MSAKSKEQLINESYEDAISVVEDFEHLQRVIEKAETNPTDLRHASAILRRWLVEGVLQRVSNPRCGNLCINAIDNKPIYRVTRSGKEINSFVSAGVQVHGIYIAAGMMNAGSNPIKIDDYHPDNIVKFPLKTFQKQQVIYSDGRWITRHQVIKFVANVDRGVHSGTVKKDWEEVLSKFRQQFSIELGMGPDEKKMPIVSWNMGEAAGNCNPRDYNPNRVNGVLLELLATIGFLTSSDDMARLIKVVRTELQ